jgi:hypothetical protein
MEKFKLSVICGFTCAIAIHILNFFFPVDLILQGIAILAGLIIPLVVNNLPTKKQSISSAEDIEDIYDKLDAFKEELNRIENMALTSQVSLSYLKQSDVLEKLAVLETRIRTLEKKLEIED